MIASVKVSYDELRRRILSVDEEQLTESMIEQLIKFLPGADEIAQIGAMKEEYDQLAEAEQFVCKVRFLRQSYCAGNSGRKWVLGIHLMF